MEKFYVVEVVNELTVTREYYQVEAQCAMEAVYLVQDKIGDAENYIIANVFVESDEVWH